MPLLLQQVAGHFENLPVYNELLNPTLLWQVSKWKTQQIIVKNLSPSRVSG